MFVIIMATCIASVVVLLLVTFTFIGLSVASDVVNGHVSIDCGRNFIQLFPDALVSDDFQFTHNWFQMHQKAWSAFVSPAVVDMMNKGPVRVLEIGCYEGLASVSMLINMVSRNPLSEYVCIDPFVASTDAKQKEWHGDPTMRQWMNNIQLTGFAKQAVLVRAESRCAFPYLDSINLNEYHFIYVDGSHMRLDVAHDAEMAFDMLTEGGVMVFDDYGWDLYPVGPNHPKQAIDAFLHRHHGCIKVLEIGYQVYVKKTCTIMHAYKKWRQEDPTVTACIPIR